MNFLFGAYVFFLCLCLSSLAEAELWNQSYKGKFSSFWLRRQQQSLVSVFQFCNVLECKCLFVCTLFKFVIAIIWVFLYCIIINRNAEKTWEFIIIEAK